MPGTTLPGAERPAPLALTSEENLPRAVAPTPSPWRRAVPSRVDVAAIRKASCGQERTAEPARTSCEPSRSYALVGSSFLGVTGLLVCHRWLWMVMASTLADNVFAGMWLNCFLSELYL